MKNFTATYPTLYKAWSDEKVETNCYFYLYPEDPVNYVYRINDDSGNYEGGDGIYKV